MARRGGLSAPVASGAHCASQPVRQHFVVAHGFEADPGAQVDRTLMERDPHAVVEGVAIAAWAVRAECAIIVVRTVCGTAAARLREAIAAAESRGYIGAEAAETGRPLRIEVRELTGSLRGRRGDRPAAGPRGAARPAGPAPAVSVAGGPVGSADASSTTSRRSRPCPGSSVTAPAPMPRWATPEAPGTTLVQLGGVVRKPGIVEVPLGAHHPRRARRSGRLRAGHAEGRPGGWSHRAASCRPRPSIRRSPTVALRGGRGAGGLGHPAGPRRVDLPRRPRRAHDAAISATRPAARPSPAASARVAWRSWRAAFCSGHARPDRRRLIGDLAQDIRDAALCGLEAGRLEPAASAGCDTSRGVRGPHRAWSLPSRRLPAHRARRSGTMIAVARHESHRGAGPAEPRPLTR